ncbi:bacteriohemerythrin [Oceanospirillum beijerinckii]|uniref:bacteriohemerythrin n=1 Tax=Oceanospirillum beijerinckii TaxID=64976 RepID=UPI0004083C05|nr:hemerythrin family protein [Oceanospirillum beijerinckii]
MSDLIADLRTQHYDQPAMDKAHHRFTALLGALPLATKQAIPALLASLRREVIDHFDQEERFMQMTGYERYDAHREQHQLFLKQLDEYQNVLESDGADIQKVHWSLCQWQHDHEKIWDEPLASFLNYNASWHPHHIEEAS